MSIDSPLYGKHVVLGISGGIAAYKSAVLARLLVKAGAEVQVIMTPSAREFITPLTMSTLTGKPVISEFFTANTGEWHSHVDLGLWADIFPLCSFGAPDRRFPRNTSMILTAHSGNKRRALA